jgi:hypothetical protein
MRYPRRTRTGVPAHSSDPVFVDRTGRRRRLTVLTGVGAGTALVASLGLIVAGFLGGSSTSIPGWPTGAGPKQPDRGVVADEVIASPTGPGVRPPTATTSGNGTQRTPTGATPATPLPAATAPPGQSAEHRATPGGRVSKSPGKPR